MQKLQLSITYYYHNMNMCKIREKNQSIFDAFTTELQNDMKIVFENRSTKRKLFKIINKKTFINDCVFVLYFDLSLASVNQVFLSSFAYIVRLLDFSILMHDEIVVLSIFLLSHLIYFLSSKG